MTTALRADRDIFATPPRRLLWGIAPTGEPHFGYILPLLVMKRLKKAGTQIIPLIANWHGYLDSQKTAWPEIERRTKTYREWFESVGFADAIETSDFYTKADYIELMFKSSPAFKIDDCLDACATTVKAARADQTAAEIIYTLTQIIDIVYLDIDCALCGEDEAPIYEYGLPRLKDAMGHDCTGAYVRLSPGLVDKEMHSSTPAMNKLMLSDNTASLREKIANHLRLLPAGTGSLFPAFLCGPIAEMMPASAELDALRQPPRDAVLLAEALTRAIIRIFDEVRA
jgi:tyrosyl-tRNA synthetase